MASLGGFKPTALGFLILVLSVVGVVLASARVPQTTRRSTKLGMWSILSHRGPGNNGEAALEESNGGIQQRCVMKGYGCWYTDFQSNCCPDLHCKVDDWSITDMHCCEYVSY